MTFSIAAQCAKTGAIGAAISSSSPAVAGRCVWISPQCGAVLSQNITDPAIGQAGLALLERGYEPAAVLAHLRARAFFEWRQVAVLDTAGNSATHSGSHTLGVHATSPMQNCVAAGNMLHNAHVPQVMVQAFINSAQVDLPSRLLDALIAGHEAGGEVGPVHSAGLKVYAQARRAVVDLRVDWSDAPIAGLSALWQRYQPQMAAYVQRANNPYRTSTVRQGDEAFVSGLHRGQWPTGATQPTTLKAGYKAAAEFFTP